MLRGEVVDVQLALRPTPRRTRLPQAQFGRAKVPTPGAKRITLLSDQSPRLPFLPTESPLNKTPNFKQQKKRREEMQKKRNEEKQRQQAERKAGNLPPKP